MERYQVAVCMMSTGLIVAIPFEKTDSMGHNMNERFARAATITVRRLIS